MRKVWKISVLDVDEDGILDSDDNCVDIANPDQTDIDLDGDGDACDPCDNQNVYTFGNINGTVAQDGSAIVDIFDVMELVDILLDNNQESCGSEIADMNVDGNQNVVDIIFLVQMLLGGEFEIILPQILVFLKLMITVKIQIFLFQVIQI